MASSRTRYFTKKLFELTGFVPIGAFLIEHLYSNFQAVGPGGPERFDRVVRDLQTNPIVIFLEIFLIGLPLLYHAGYGLFVAQQARPNVGAYGYGRNWMYLLQRVTGVILVFYIGYHVWRTRLEPLVNPDNPLLQKVEGQALVSTRYMHDYLNEVHLGIRVYWIYLVGVLSAVFHFSNGLWNLAYHWGLTVSPRSQKLWGYACGIIGVTLLAVALASLRAFINVSA
jgi:succinate dehydrogenase / fumarate reductase cytochrome b subunit